jgi:predicted amidohydrolase
METIKIATVSLNIQENQPKKNIRNIAKWTQKAATGGAEVILCPELSVSGGEQHSEPIPGPSADQLTAIAKESGCILCVGVSECDAHATYNTQILLSGTGIIGKQRKLHLPSSEVAHRVGGAGVHTFSIGKARIGMAICYDTFFPEIARMLYLQGADILLMPYKESHSPPRNRVPEEALYVLAARVSCWTNGCYGVVCNWAGTPQSGESAPKFGHWPGWAGIFDPQGRVVEFTREDGNDEAMILAELDPQLLQKRRQHPEFTPNRLRPDLYVYHSQPLTHPQRVKGE